VVALDGARSGRPPASVHRMQDKCNASAVCVYRYRKGTAEGNLEAERKGLCATTLNGVTWGGHAMSVSFIMIIIVLQLSLTRGIPPAFSLAQLLHPSCSGGKPDSKQPEKPPEANSQFSSKLHTGKIGTLIGVTALPRARAA
jgi:hypothetical protein